MPPAKFLPEKDDIFFASKIEIEGDDATRHWDGGEANHINATVVEPNPYAAHEVAERIAASAFYACTKPCGSIHVAPLLPVPAGAHESLQSTTCLIPRAWTIRLAYRLVRGLVKILYGTAQLSLLRPPILPYANRRSYSFVTMR